MNTKFYPKKLYIALILMYILMTGAVGCGSMNVASVSANAGSDENAIPGLENVNDVDQEAVQVTGIDLDDEPNSPVDDPEALKFPASLPNERPTISDEEAIKAATKADSQTDETVVAVKEAQAETVKSPTMETAKKADDAGRRTRRIVTNAYRVAEDARRKAQEANAAGDEAIEAWVSAIGEYQTQLSTFWDDESSLYQEVRDARSAGFGVACPMAAKGAPVGVALGLPAAVLVGVYPAVNGNFFLPTYGTVLAAVSFDQTGTTRIGRYLLNHSFMIPGLVTTATATVVALLLGSILIR